jgi:hypothetical protein
LLSFQNAAMKYCQTSAAHDSSSKVKSSSFPLSQFFKLMEEENSFIYNIRACKRDYEAS